MMRSKLNWTKLLFYRAYALTFLIVALWLTAEQLIQGKGLHWSDVLQVLFVLGIVFVWFYVSGKRADRKARLLLDQNFPDSIQLDASGIKMESNNGANSFTPWSALKGWRTGRQVILAYSAEGKHALLLPLSEISAPAQENLRGTVESYLGPPTNRREFSV